MTHQFMMAILPSEMDPPLSIALLRCLAIVVAFAAAAALIAGWRGSVRGPATSAEAGAPTTVPPRPWVFQMGVVAIVGAIGCAIAAQRIEEIDRVNRGNSRTLWMHKSFEQLLHLAQLDPTTSDHPGAGEPAAMELLVRLIAGELDDDARTLLAEQWLAAEPGASLRLASVDSGRGGHLWALDNPSIFLGSSLLGRTSGDIAKRIATELYGSDRGVDFPRRWNVRPQSSIPLIITPIAPGAHVRDADPERRWIGIRHVVDASGRPLPFNLDWQTSPIPLLRAPMPSSEDPSRPLRATLRVAALPPRTNEFTNEFTLEIADWIIPAGYVMSDVALFADDANPPGVAPLVHRETLEITVVEHGQPLYELHVDPRHRAAMRSAFVDADLVVQTRAHGENAALFFRRGAPDVPIPFVARVELVWEGGHIDAGTRTFDRPDDAGYRATGSLVMHLSVPIPDGVDRVDIHLTPGSDLDPANGAASFDRAWGEPIVLERVAVVKQRSGGRP